ncbi:MAG: ABC transporter permease [Myxococcota bacterium]|nr:ABC transporter permease [Myxococcota bacterium]MDW8362642.1 ABC transporter permease [Myxococcales bacterium]
MSERRVRLPALGGLAAGLVVLEACAVLVLMVGAGRLASSSPGPGTPELGLGVLAAWGALAVVSLGVGLLALPRIRRVQRGTRGRGRLQALALLAVALSLGVIIQGALVLAAVYGSASDKVPGGGVVELLQHVPGPLLAALLVVSALLSVGCLVALVLGAASWTLLPARWRRIWLGGLDALLLTAFVLLTVLVPLEPLGREPRAALWPAIRLAVMALFVLRLSVRLVPKLLEALERVGPRALIAARQLRTRQSGFLTAIGGLSILAVAFSSCSLVTTLSVMGGFRQDLKRKILGNHAHVGIDVAHGGIDGWRAVLERVRADPAVRGASAYVQGEVMLTSATNLGGALLRGIETRSATAVTDLGRNLVHGRLEYLDDPERLARLSPAELGAPASLVTGPAGRRHDPVDADPTVATGLVERILGELAPDGGAGTLGAADGGASTPERGSAAVVPPEAQPADEASSPGGPEPGPARRVLPGIVVGQELARALRLYVGDEVDVVSPLGDLGPTGPVPRTRPFRVAGIFYTGLFEHDVKYVYVSLPTAQQFLQTGDRISGIEVRVAELERAPEVAERLRRAIGRPELRVRPWQELNRHLFGALALEKLAMFVVLGIAIVVAGFCVFATLTLLVQEKTREVGVLRALGARSATLVGIFLLEGALIGALGAGAGLGLGHLVCFAAERFGVGLNPEVYYIDRLPVHVDPVELLSVGVTSALVCLLATLYPALFAARLDPVEALRHR